MEPWALYHEVKEAVASNNGKLPAAFIDKQVEAGTTTYTHLTPNMRVCVIRLQSGHEVIGVAQVLDSNNDVEEIGNSVAFTNAKNELWKVFGAIALA